MSLDGAPYAVIPLASASGSWTGSFVATAAGTYAVRAAQGPTEGHALRVRVTDVTGSPVAGASVLVEDLVAPLPFPMSSRTLATDADGEAEFTLAPEGGLVGLPLAHTVRATASAPSIAGAPVQDPETAIVEYSFRNEATLLAGLPLP